MRKQSHINAKGKRMRKRRGGQGEIKKEEKKRERKQKTRKISGGRAVKARNKASRELARCHFLRKSTFFSPPHARPRKRVGTMVAREYTARNELVGY